MGTGGGEHPPRNTWRGYEHTIYWLLRMCHHMTPPTIPPWRRVKVLDQELAWVLTDVQRVDVCDGSKASPLVQPSSSSRSDRWYGGTSACGGRASRKWEPGWRCRTRQGDGWTGLGGGGKGHWTVWWWWWYWGGARGGHPFQPVEKIQEISGINILTSLISWISQYW
jgi:hypothetical protein